MRIVTIIQAETNKEVHKFHKYWTYNKHWNATVEIQIGVPTWTETVKLNRCVVHPRVLCFKGHQCK
jgi:hypothetical protein